MEVRRNIEVFVAKLPRIILLCVVLFLISRNFKEEKKINNGSREEKQEIRIPEDSIRKYFPRYTGLERISPVEYDVKEGEKEVGKLILTTPVADDLIGYAGPVPLFLAVSDEGIVSGLTLLENNESRGFVRRLERRGFFDSWNGKRIEEVGKMEVEAVSGATLTSEAVRMGVKRAVGEYLNEQDHRGNDNVLTLLRHVLGGVVVLFAIVSLFRGASMKKYRSALQVASILILGFWSGSFISLELLYGWLLNGIPWGVRVLLPVIALLAVICPLFFNRSYYCAYLCPFGAAQELMGKVRRKKITFGRRVKMVLKYTRITFFLGIMGLLLWGIPLDLTSLEPFSAFLVSVASGGMIAFALTCLLISVFISRPWCNYFCPTGEFLDILRRTPGKEGGKQRRETWQEWLSVTVFLLLLWFVLS